ncbi:MAG: hypothetical protein N2651_05975 [Fimbriimonadales bacterium]|nr:hypothetical protein [Fimbriimonadales bacterium]
MMRETLKQIGSRAFVMLSVLLSVWTSSDAQRLVWLGVPEGSESIAMRVSDDGTLVAGRTGNMLTNSSAADAFLWNLRTNTVVRLSNNGGAPFGMTPDGGKIVGDTNRYGASNTSFAFLWTPAGGTQILPAPSGTTHWAINITPDGSRACGAVKYYGPAIWDTASNPPRLLRTYSNLAGEMRDLSDDVRTAVRFDGTRGRIWRLNDQLNIQSEVILAPFSSDPYTLAVNLSPDGDVAVGMSGEIADIWLAVGNNYRPAMWRAARNWQVEPLATLGGQRGFAWDVNADTIVGFCSTPSGENRAVRWRISTAATQVEDLNVTYASLLSNGSRLRVAYGMSRNGRFIVGTGLNAATGRQEAFLLDTRRTGDVDGNGCVDDADLLSVLFAFGQSGSNPADVNGDGIVDDADLLEVLFNFGSGC